MSLYLDSIKGKLVLAYGRLFGVSWQRHCFNNNDYSNHYITDLERGENYWDLLKYYFKDIGVIDFLTLGILPFLEFNLLLIMGMKRSSIVPWYDGKCYTPYIIPLVFMGFALLFPVLVGTYLTRFCFAITVLLLSAPLLILYHYYQYKNFVAKCQTIKLIKKTDSQFEMETIEKEIAPGTIYKLRKPKCLSLQEILDNPGLNYLYAYKVNSSSLDLEFGYDQVQNTSTKYHLFVKSPEYLTAFAVLLYMNFQFIKSFSMYYYNPTILFKNEPLDYRGIRTRDLTGWNKEGLQYGEECIGLFGIINKFKIPKEISRIILTYLIDSQFKIKTKTGLECLTSNAHLFFAEKSQKFYNERLANKVNPIDYSFF